MGGRKMIFDYFYNKGYEAGVNAQKLSDHEDQNRRLEDMLKHGKELGRTEGWMEGYNYGLAEGKAQAEAEIGEIDLDEIKDEFTGFKGLVNEEGVVEA
jgi:hypothetical protein